MFNWAFGRFLRNRRVWLLGAVFVLIAGVTIHHIGSSPAGLSPSEATSKIQSSNWHTIFSHPLNLPHNLTTFGTQRIHLFGNSGLRLASYIYALVFSVSFYYLARSWFGKTVGILSTLVFCLSPFFLIPARLASFEIMFFWPVTLMTVYHWLNKTDKKILAWLVLALATGIALYTPGLIWWVFGTIIICRKKLLFVTGQLPQSVVAAGLLLVALILVPAGLAIFKDWHFINNIAALPTHWPSPVKLVKNIGWMISSIGVKTPYHDQLIIGRLPFLDFIQLGLVVFGGYAMATAAKTKAAAFGLSIVLAVTLAAINGNIEFLLLGLPAAGIFMAAGLRYLYIEWRGVFPRNPIPKSLALILMSVLVGIQLVYGVSYSLVAWPHTADTKAIYVLK